MKGKAFISSGGASTASLKVWHARLKAWSPASPVKEVQAPHTLGVGDHISSMHGIARALAQEAFLVKVVASLRSRAIKTEAVELVREFDMTDKCYSADSVS